MLLENIKNQFVPKYLSIGEIKFYKFLICYAISKLSGIENKSYKGISPEIEFLTIHEHLIILYRREGDQVYLDLAIVFRKAAHKIYRVMLKRNLINKSIKFLNIV